MNNQIVVDVPIQIRPYIDNKQSVCIDFEIVYVIRYLWNHKILTLGCCSGHNKTKPNIVIADRYNNEEIKKIHSLINDVDIRDWEIYQWRLCLISKDGMICAK